MTPEDGRQRMTRRDATAGYDNTTGFLRKRRASNKIMNIKGAYATRLLRHMQEIS
ncbi:hypothetical protein DPMN_185081 [Dreissena polymorpha]|uniref:Uncharacterized protein n=1 Tax=Dreissena polymorpha TaxID=45954 RepID=A0A9D4DJR2_DREPO|nr:hypothetical protein DPMN_185081 [Dreissena polymorpha]